MSAPSPADDSSVQQQPTPVRRGRGRPRKNPQTTVSRVLDQGAASGQMDDARGQAPPTKRGRGRPKKNTEGQAVPGTTGSSVLNQGAAGHQTDDGEDEAPPAKRRPGRPRKEVQAPATRRRRGRPRNSERETSEDGEEEDEEDVRLRKRHSLALEYLTKRWPTMRKRANEEFPAPMTLDDFMAAGRPGCPQPEFDELWSIQDEEGLMANWDASEWKASVESIDRGHFNLLSLWRGCIRRFGIDPVTLILGDGDLDVAVTSSQRVNLDNKLVQSCLWPDRFCYRLLRILCHPFWRGPDVLRLALKYTARCRQDSSDKVYKDVWPTDCNVLQDVFSGNRYTHLPLHERHLQLREKARSDGIYPSIESDLLIQLSSAMPQSPQPIPQDKLELVVADVDRLKHAMDNLACQGLPMLMPTDIVYQVFMSARGDKDVVADREGTEIPHDYDELIMLHTNCLLNKRRQEVRESRREQALFSMGGDDENLLSMVDGDDGNVGILGQNASPTVADVPKTPSQAGDQPQAGSVGGNEDRNVSPAVAEGLKVPSHAGDQPEDGGIDAGLSSQAIQQRLASVEPGGPLANAPNIASIFDRDSASNSTPSTGSPSPTKADEVSIHGAKDGADESGKSSSQSLGPDGETGQWEVHEGNNVRSKWGYMRIGSGHARA